MGTDINGYSLIGELSTSNAGMCQWGFAVKNHHEYFIKEFLSPKYPLDESKLGPELTKKMRVSADAFFKKRKAYYDRLSTCRTGNIIVNLDFFRWGAKYYAVTDKVSGELLDVDEISALPEDRKRTLIKSLLYSMSILHRAGIVHSDLKPENILVKRAQDGYCTAKIIDFEAGFLTDSIPDNIECSQNYFAPEAVLRMNGKNVPVTTKADVFALGLLIHQYWCGKMPEFPDEYRYASEAVLGDALLTLDEAIPSDVRVIVEKMTSKDPDSRPSAWSAWEQLGKPKDPPPIPAPKPEPMPIIKSVTVPQRLSMPSENELD